ncbi:hypothetical protein TWF281_006781 [Arthrobotrys megalospora]
MLFSLFSECYWEIVSNITDQLSTLDLLALEQTCSKMGNLLQPIFARRSSLPDLLQPHFKDPVKLLIFMRERKMVLTGRQALNIWFPGSARGADYVWQFTTDNFAGSFQKKRKIVDEHFQEIQGMQISDGISSVRLPASPLASNSGSVEYGQQITYISKDDKNTLIVEVVILPERVDLVEGISLRASTTLQCVYTTTFSSYIAFPQLAMRKYFLAMDDPDHPFNLAEFQEIDKPSFAWVSPLIAQLGHPAPPEELRTKIEYRLWSTGNPRPSGLALKFLRIYREMHGVLDDCNVYYWPEHELE